MKKERARLAVGFARPALARWALHALSSGAGLGAALGLAGGLGQRFLLHAEPGPRPSWSALAGAGMLSTALAALGASALAVLCWPLLRWRLGRVTSLAVLGITAAGFALAHLTSSALRTLSGSFVTLGAIEFLQAGGPHLMKTIALGYGGWVLGLVLLAVLVAGTVVARAQRHMRTARVTVDAPTERTSARAWARFAAPALLAAIVLVPVRRVQGLNRVSPELAFAESFDPDPVEPEPAVPETAPVAQPVARPEVSDGPALAEGDRWKAAISAAERRRTNVLLLTLESVSIEHLGFMHYDRDTTPNLDRIAQKSWRMRRAWTTATHSNYAQMAILSSLFPRRTAGLDVYKRLDYPRVLLHDVFHELGHATATISSQDETWQGMLRFQRTPTPTFYRHSKDYGGILRDIGSELVVLDHVTVEVAIDWIRRQGNHPWSLYVNFQGTHFPYELQPGIPAPYQPTKVTRRRFDYLSYPESDRQAVINRYDNALRYVDEQIGKLERALDRQGMLDDTIWIITADHGENFHDHAQVTHGKTLFDTEARVPLLVHWPAKLQAMDIDEPVSSLDILPTILDLLELPPHPAFQGSSFANPSQHAARRTGIFLNIQGLRSAEAVVCWPWKLIVDRADHSIHLYDLEQDPRETDDRAEGDAEIAESLRAVLSAQIAAQMSYHQKDNPALTERFAPRLLACPSLPGRDKISAGLGGRSERKD